MVLSSFDLSGKVALVTGSTKGIGRGIALGLAKAGADIVVTSRHLDECEVVARIVERMGKRALPVSADVTDISSLKLMVEKVLSHFKSIDILVNNAGTSMTKRAEDITEEDWNKIINLDLKSVFFCSQLVGRHMIGRKQGKIINVASILGLIGDRQVLTYCVSKGGVIQMTKALALEWVRYNIQVNALCPGYIRTSMNDADLADERIYKHILGKIPMRRLALPEDLEGAAVFLSSAASDYMTGQALVVDGGWTAE